MAVNIKEGEFQALELAGVTDEKSFTQMLSDTAAICDKQLESTPQLTAINGYDDYRYAKSSLAAYNGVIKQADEQRKTITGKLDEAKKACMAFYKEAVAPVRQAADATKALKDAYEDAARGAKRHRLQEYWEQTYPALALCAGTAEDPLVPFDRIFDADWIKRISELSADGSKDAKAKAAMDEIAATLTGGQREIESSGQPDEVQSMAVAHMFQTLSATGNIAWAVQETRRLDDVKRLQQAQVEVANVKAADAPVQAPISEPKPQPKPSSGKRRITVEVPVDIPASRLVLVYADSDQQMKMCKSVMSGAGLHGCIGKVVKE